MPRKKILLLTSVLAAILSLIMAGIIIQHAAAQDTPLPFDLPAQGSLKDGEVNRWSFAGNRDDVIQLTVKTTQGNLAVGISLLNPANVLQAQLNGSTSPASTFVFRLPEFGEYTIELTSLNNTSGNYEITLSLLEAGLRDFEQGSLSFGQITQQRLSDTIPYHIWNFSGRAGQVVDIRMTTTDGDLEPVITLTSPGGDVIGSSNADSRSPKEAHLLAFRLPGDGTYRISTRRAGTALGFNGNTSGSYELSLILRNGPAATTSPVRSGDQVIGRLTEDSPIALYEMIDPGIYALTVEFDNPTCLIELGITNEGLSLIEQTTVRSPLMKVVTIPDAQAPIVEISSSHCLSSQPINFIFSPTKIEAEQPVQFLPDRATVNSAGEARLDRWFFQGQAGDLIQIKAQRNALLTDSFIRLVSPKSVTLYREAFYTQFDQTFYLQESGIHYIQVASNTIPYTLTRNLVGQNGILFSNATPIWETQLDIASPQAWQFIVTSPLEENSVITLEAPDGQTIAAGRATTLNPATIEGIVLRQVGRYHLKVFGERVPRNVTQQPISSGQFALGTSVKGSLSQSTTSNLWDILLEKDQEFDLTLERLNPTTAQLPNLAILNQSGELIPPLFDLSDPNSQQQIRLKAPQTGIYHVLISGSPVDYRLAAQSTYPTEPVVITITPPSSEGFTNDTVQTVNYYPIPSFTNLPASVFDSARALSSPNSVRLEIAPNQQLHLWRLSIVRNQLLTIQATNTDGGAAPGITLLDSNRQIITDHWEAQSSLNELTYRTPTASTYYLAITAPPQGGRYWVSIKTTAGVDESVPEIYDAAPIEMSRTYQADFSNMREKDTYVFWGSRNTVVNITSLYEFGELAPQLILQSPSGRTVAEADYNPETQQTLLEAIRLPESGVYQLISTGQPLQRSESYSRYSLHIALLAGQENNKGVLDQEVTGALGVVGTETTWILRAEAGENLTLTATALSTTGPVPLSLAVADSTGTTFVRKEAELSVNEVAIRDLMLPRTGIYRVIVRGGNDSFGNYRLTLERGKPAKPNVTSSVGYGDSTEGILTEQYRINRWMLGGNKGDVITIAARPRLGDPTLIGFQLESATGQVLRIGADRSNGGGAREENIVLPETGLYYITVGTPQADFVGSSTYQLAVELQSQIHPATSGGLIPYNQSYGGIVFADDPSDVWLFNGQAGQAISIEVQGDGILKPRFDLIAYNATSQADMPEPLLSRSGATRASLDSFVLPSDGAYAIMVGGIEDSTGAYILQIQHNDDPIINSQHLENNQTYTQVLQRGEIQRWSFSGQVGDTVTATVTVPRRSSLIPTLTLISPQGEKLLFENRFDGTTVQLDAYLLPLDGIYRLEISGSLADINARDGTYSLTVTTTERTPLPNPLPISYNKTGLNTLSDTKRSERWVFEGQAGDMVRIRGIRTNGDLDMTLSLSTVTGEVIASDDDSLGNLDAEITTSLPTTGTYIITVGSARSHISEPQNNYRLELSLDYRPASSSLNPDQFINYGTRLVGSFEPLTPTSPETQSWYFAAQAQDQVTIAVQFPPNDSPLRLFLADGAGNIYIQGERLADRAVIRDFTLPANGAYQIIVQRSLDSLVTQHYPYTLSLALTADQDTNQATGGFIQKGSSQGKQFTATTPTHTWFYYGQAQETLHLSLMRLTGEITPSLLVYTPGNQVILTQTGTSTIAGYNTSLTLPSTGVYQLIITNPNQTSLVDYRLALSSDTPQNLAGQLTLQETDYGSLDSHTPEAVWLIQGRANTSLYIRAETVTGNLSLTARLEDREGIVRSQGQYDLPTGDIVLIYPTTAEEYRLIISREGGNLATTAGTYRLRLSYHPINAAMLASETLQPNMLLRGFVDKGQTSLYGLVAQKNIPISLYVTTDDPAQTPHLRIFSEEGQEITQAEGTLYNLYVPEDGYYFIEVSYPNPLRYQIGQFPRPPLSVSTTAPTRRQVNLSGMLSQADPAQLWSIEADTGETLLISVSDFSQTLRSDLILFDPDDLPIATSLEVADSNDTVLGPIFMAKAGTYTLRVGAWLGQASASGTQYIVRIDPVSEDSPLGSEGGHITVLGQSVSGGVAPSDPSDTWTFDGQAGSFLQIQLQSFPLVSVPLSLSLSSPSGDDISLESYVTETPEGLLIDNLPLPANGQYRLSIHLDTPMPSDPVGYDLQVHEKTPDWAMALSQARSIILGEPQTGTLEGQTNQAWVFFGSAGQNITITTDSEGLPFLTLLDPTGKPLYTQQVEISALLLQDGFYSIVISSTQATSYTLLIENAPLHANWRWGLPLTTTERAVLSPGAPLHQWDLTGYGTGDYTITIRPTSLEWQPYAYVMNQNGEAISTMQIGASGGLELNLYLDAGQLYSLFVTAQSQLLGAYDITFDVTQNAQSPAFIQADRTVGGRLTTLDSTDEWIWINEANAALTIQLIRTAGTAALTIRLYAPGYLLLSEYPLDETGALTVRDIPLPVTGSYILQVVGTNVTSPSTEGLYELTISNP